MRFYRSIRAALGLVKRFWRVSPWVLQNSRVIDPVCPLGDRFFRGLLLDLQSRTDTVRVMQVGANTGMGSHDLSDVLRSPGISSALVEPQPDVFQVLKSNFAERSNMKLINAALDIKTRQRHIYRLRESANQYHVRGGKFGKSIGSFEREHPLHYFKKNCTEAGSRVPDADLLESVPVDGVTVSELMKQADFESLDVLMIDVEGFDYVALKLFLEAGLRPQLVRFEHVHLQGDDVKAWTLLRDAGYLMVLDSVNGETIASLK